MKITALRPLLTPRGARGIGHVRGPLRLDRHGFIWDLWKPFSTYLVTILIKNYTVLLLLLLPLLLLFIIILKSSLLS